MPFDADRVFIKTPKKFHIDFPETFTIVHLGKVPVNILGAKKCGKIDLCDLFITNP
jgi:hypothetical protein